MAGCGGEGRGDTNDPEIVTQLRNVGRALFYHDSAEIKEYTLREMNEIKELWGIK